MPFLQAKTTGSPSTPVSPKRGAFGFSGRLTQPFWKSKSKNSVGSESQGSMSTISVVGSPPFTPDSSLSIYTNSLDSDCSNSNSSTTSNSNQISPIQNNVVSKKKPSNILIKDQISSYSYDNDCERYASNMYYDMGDSSSFECRVPLGGTIDRFRNNASVRLTHHPFEEDDGVHSYYNNSTFTTFPNPRRHSFAYSSCSSSLTSNASSTKKEEMIELLPCAPQGPDGYLIPISGLTGEFNSRQTSWSKSSSTNNKKNLYMNESAMVTNEIVQVDVHHSTTSTTPTLESTSTTTRCGKEDEEKDVNTHHSKIDQISSSKGDSRQASNDSDSTTTIVPPNDSSFGFIHKDKILPLYMSRIFVPTNDCEPFCSLCATSAVKTSNKTSKMDVAIISCQECFFSRVAEKHIRGFFDRMVTPENQKLDIVLQAYDLKDLDHHAVAAEVHRAKVQIVIISNHFLDRLRHENSYRKKLSPVNRVLRSKRVIAVIASTGITAAEISEGYQAVLARFDEWFTVELRSTTKLDADFCKKFTDQVVKIYNVELSIACNFSVFPKKVTKEQPKIVIMLKKPVEEGEQVKIELTRGRDMETMTSVPITNPYTIIIRIPESLCANRTALLEITVHVNQQKLGTKLVKYEYNSKNAEDDVIDHMGKALPGFMKTLDDHISQTLSKNFRACTDWTLDPDLELLNDVLISKGDDFPTPMHFAAFYGLEQTVWTLLDEADGLEQCSLPNDVNETPIDIAQGKIAQIIKDYQDMTVTWKAFQYVKDLVDRKSEQLSIPIIIENEIDGDSTILMNGVDHDEEQGEDEEIKVEGEERELHYPMLQTMEELDEADLTTVENSDNTKNDLPSQNHNGYLSTSTETSSASYVNITGGDLGDVVDDEAKIVLEIPKVSPIVPTRRCNFNRQSYNRTKQDRHSMQRPLFSGMITVNREIPASESHSHPSSPIIQPEYAEVDESPSVPRLKPKAQQTLLNNLFPNYDIPRFEEYKIPPSETRPVLPNKLVPTSRGLSDKAGPSNNHLNVNTNQHNLEDYLIIEEPEPTTTTNFSDLFFDPHPIAASGVRRVIGDEEDDDIDDISQSGRSHLPTLTSGSSHPLNNYSSQPYSAPPIKLDPTDEELVDLLNDYKNNVYSMRELELLFAHWKERADVKSSYRERNDQLHKLREEYKRIQEQMQRNNRRPSILTKVLVNVFGSRKKSSEKSNTRTISEPTITEENMKLMGASEPPRNLSGNSDPVESGNNSGGSSSSIKSDCVSETSTEVISERTPVWVHPLNQVAGQYVPPSLSSSPQPPPLVVSISDSNTNNQSKEPVAPPRPAKKSTMGPPSPDLRPPSPRVPKQKKMTNKTSEAPPPAPPRNAINSPFNLINYNSRNNDGPLCPANGAPKPSFNKSYVNGDITVSKS